jgi:hypothetical protein
MRRLLIAVGLGLLVWGWATAARPENAPPDSAGVSREAAPDSAASKPVAPAPDSAAAAILRSLPKSTGPEAGADTAALADTTLSFDLEVGNRMYPKWKEAHTVKLGQAMYLGDTPYTARVSGFMPDFKIANGKPVNFSMQMKNPAVHVLVFKEGAAVDSSWAFLNFPPHFSPKSFFTFQLKEVRGYEPPATQEK